MTQEQMEAGDDMIHGEAAYVLGPCEAHEHLLAGHYAKRSDTQPGELGMGGVTLGMDPQRSMMREDHGHDNITKAKSTPSNGTSSEVKME